MSRRARTKEWLVAREDLSPPAQPSSTTLASSRADVKMVPSAGEGNPDKASREHREPRPRDQAFLDFSGTNSWCAVRRGVGCRLRPLASRVVPADRGKPGMGARC